MSWRADHYGTQKGIDSLVLITLNCYYLTKVICASEFLRAWNGGEPFLGWFASFSRHLAENMLTVHWTLVTAAANFNDF